MNSVLLLNPPGDKLYIRDYYCSFSSKADYYWPPQDLIVLSGILSEKYKIKIIDAIINKISADECLKEVLNSDYKAIIFTTGTATLNSDLELMGKIKNERKDIKIIASAGIMKFIYKQFLNTYEFIDGILIDFTERDILFFIENNYSTPLKGLIYRKGKELIEYNERLPLKFTIPIPKHELFDFRKYKIPIAKNFPFTVVITSLGCPYNCAFCTAGAYGYRIRIVDNVIEELIYLAKLGVKEILFQDPTFTLNKKRIIELCKKIINNGLNFTWSCNADIRSLDEEKIYWMKKAGCHTVSIGIESGDDSILKKYSKMITVEHTRKAIDLLNKYKIRILGYFIIGLPGETKESILKTIKLAKSLKIDIASFSIATPDLGTRLRQEAIEKGWIPPNALDFDSTEFPIIETDKLKREEIWQLRKKAIKEFYLRPSYILRKLFQIHSIKELKIIISNAISLLSK
ncbi:radical SAM protein [Candidatus Aminicenantes bacterium AH-873-B07]|nr:radical SAM protein [Candidatus Aminicenantes bacterium AH-873-B07]